jgi:uncharacterized protein (DUF2141 family)
MRSLRSTRAIAPAILVGLVGLVGLAGMPSHARAEGAKVALTVTAVGFRDAKGQALVALFDAKDAWPKLQNARALEKVKPIKDGTVAVTWRDLPPGEYAVSVIHDENENGKLDMRWLPYPKPAEGAGASNDAEATIGPPSWADARFKLTAAGGAITIHMRYW